MAFEVAQRLSAPLDVFIVRKLGSPGHEELAMGAIATGGVLVLNHDVVTSPLLDSLSIDTVFNIPATTQIGTNIFFVGVATIGQMSFWGNYLPRVYPTHLRGTGAGWAAGFGRIASILAPLSVPLMPCAKPTPPLPMPCSRLPMRCAAFHAPISSGTPIASK